MPKLVPYDDSLALATAEHTISDGGDDQVTFIDFPGLPNQAEISIVVAADSWFTHVGTETSALDATKRFPLLAGGINTYTLSDLGAGSAGVPRIRLAGTSGTVVNIAARPLRT